MRTAINVKVDHRGLQQERTYGRTTPCHFSGSEGTKAVAGEQGCGTGGAEKLRPVLTELHDLSVRAGPIELNARGIETPSGAAGTSRSSAACGSGSPRSTKRRELVRRT